MNHTTHPQFGLRVFSQPEDYFIALGEYRNAWRKKIRSPSGWAIEYALRVFYDSYFSIGMQCYDRDNKLRRYTESNNSLRLVEMNTSEGVLESNRFRHRAWEYRTYKINEVMGMSFKEWLSLPTAHLDMILDDIRAEANDQLNHQKRQAKEMEQYKVDGPIHPDQQARLLNHLSSTSKAL